MIFVFVHAVNESAETMLRASLALHHNIISINNDDVIQLQVAPPIVRGNAVQQHVAVMQTAAQHVMLSMYRNQIIHVFIRPAMIALSINSCRGEELSLGTLSFFPLIYPVIHQYRKYSKRNIRFVM